MSFFNDGREPRVECSQNREVGLVVLQKNHLSADIEAKLR